MLKPDFARVILRIARRGCRGVVFSIPQIIAVTLLLSGCMTSPVLPERVDSERPFQTPLPVERAAVNGPDGNTETVSMPDGQLTPLDLTMDEAVLLALEHNRDLRVIRFEPAIRREREAIERAIFAPVFSLEAYERRARAELRTQGGDIIREEGTVFEGDMSVFNPLGTRWGIDAGTERVRRGDDERYISRLGVSARQPLLRGAGSTVNLAELRKARLDTRLSEYELRAVAETLAARVESAYWAYSLALQRIEMVEESLRLAERQLGETRQRIRVGDLPPTEQAAAETEVALRREARIDAVSRKQILRVRLLRLVQPERLRWADSELNMTDEPSPPAVALQPLEEHLKAALDYRPDLNQARLRVERGEIDLVLTGNGMLPRMDLFVQLGKTGYADSFGESVANLDGDGYEALAGVIFEWPHGNQAARARYRQTEWSQEQVLESLHNITDLVREDVHVAHVEVRRAREQVQAKSATRALQQETVRAETAKFAAGQSTALLVAQAQRELLAARIAEAEALVEYRQALTNLYRLDGTLLMRRGIAAPGLAGK